MSESKEIKAYRCGDKPINPESAPPVPYSTDGRILKLDPDTPSINFRKTLADIIRCFDIAQIIKNIQSKVEYVVQVPAKFQPGLKSGEYAILTSPDGTKWPTLYKVVPGSKPEIVCNMPIEAKKLVQGNPIHDLSANMQMMALQQQITQLTELVQETYEAVKRIEQGQTDDRVGKLRAGKEGMEQALVIEDPVQRKIAIGNAQQLLLEARGQIGETLSTKVKSFPAIPESQFVQFMARLSSKRYFAEKDEAFTSIQRYYQLYLLATQLLADSYSYCEEPKAAEKVYQDAISFMQSLDFAKVKTLHNIHPNVDFSDTICEKAVPYILAEQEQSKMLAQPYDTIEFKLTGDIIMEVLDNGEQRIL